jgi:hypothetical protein
VRSVLGMLGALAIAALTACGAVAQTTALGRATDEATRGALTGRADDAYAQLTALAATAPAGDPALPDAWRTLAGLAELRGDSDAAIAQLTRVLDHDPDDDDARDALADLLLATSRPAAAARLLAGREAIDSHLVRRAIAEHTLHGRTAEALVAAARARLATAAPHGELRDAARFALAIELDPDRAVALARDNWRRRHGLADARLLAETAVAARDRDAAAPAFAWARTAGIHDAALDRWRVRLADDRTVVPAPDTATAGAVAHRLALGLVLLLWIAQAPRPTNRRPAPRAHLT